MTIQTRPDGLIFADSAKNGEVESFPNLLRGWGITLDQTEGIPPMEWFNALFQRQDKAIKYLLQQGITQWHKDEEYPKDAIVKHEGKTWQATQDNKGKVPQNDSVDWKMFGDGYSKAEANATFVKTNDLVGIPIPYPTNTPPNGYLAMVGQDINKEQYPILHNLYNGKLPDMRDRYVRGANGTRGGVPLTLQDDAIRNITGQIGSIISTDDTSSGAFRKVVRGSPAYNGNTSGNHANFLLDTSRVVPTAEENRPLSITFNYICLAR